MLSPDPIATNGAHPPQGVRSGVLVLTAGPVSYPPTSSLGNVNAVAPTSNDVQTRARHTPQRRCATFEQTARALEHSAVLAEDHAEREEQAGRREAAAKERLAADQARDAARRARAHADGFR